MRQVNNNNNNSHRVPKAENTDVYNSLQHLSTKGVGGVVSGHLRIRGRDRLRKIVKSDKKR